MILNEGVTLLGGCAMGPGLFDAEFFEGFCGGFPLGKPENGITRA
jgi:hypothetical protein